MRLLLFITFSLGVGVAPAAEQSYPLEAPDTSSPRATLNTFNESIDELYRIAREEGRSWRSVYQREAKVERCLRCLDLTEMPPVRKRSFGTEAAVCLRKCLIVTNRLRKQRFPTLPRCGSFLRREIPCAGGFRIPISRSHASRTAREKASTYSRPIPSIAQATSTSV